MTEQLDLRGLKCPLPALLARRALVRAAPGTVLQVIADDPLAAIDIPHMCAQEGFVVLAVRKDGNVASLNLQRPSGTPSAAEASPPLDPADR
jgi:tRNA 2-thiouridine synthesizing protein A